MSDADALGKTLAELGETTRGDEGPALDGALAREGFSASRRSTGQRFQIRGELGVGGQGRVLEVFDLVLRRTVAMKVLRAELGRDHDAVERFVAEAQLTAQLAHPNIIPIFDAGLAEDGSPYYVMPKLPDRTLRVVLEERLRGGEPARAHSLVRLVRLLSSVCMAVHAAHEAGVVHRDLKPGNLILGERGEIYVVDFGLARLVGSAIRTDRSDSGNAKSVMGSPVGTPLYMSPEQARGDAGITPATDVYALGAILYEILTGTPPIVRSSFVEQLVAVLTEAPAPALHGPDGRSVPPDLAALAMRCLEKDPARRPSSAAELVDEVDRWLEGSRERARRAEAAAGLVASAREVLAESAQRRAVATAELVMVKEALRAVPEHATLEVKEPLLRAEDRARAMLSEVDAIEHEGITRLEAALGAVPEHEEASTLLSRIHLARNARYETQGDLARAREEAQRARRASPRLAAETLDALGRLTVTLEGDGRFDLERYEERDRRLHAVEVARAVPSGGTLELSGGSYRVRAWSPGGREVLLPLEVRRGATVAHVLATAPADAAPPGFVYVPGGPVVLGGDPEARRSDPQREHEAPGYYIGRDPISCAEYLEMLVELAARFGAEAALARAPRPPGGGAPYWRLDPRGVPRWAERDEQGDSWAADQPVVSVSAHDAEAYAHFRGARDGRSFRLPTDDEWERAARGADGRAYPWGHHFDPAFCRMRLSLREPAMGPIGSFPIDVSPFGVRDLAGGCADWTASPYRDELRIRSVRGGGWSTRAHRCAATFRGMMDERDTSADLGFRLVAPLQRRTA